MNRRFVPIYLITGFIESGKTTLGLTVLANDRFTNGGRVLGVTARGETLMDAVANAYAAAQPIEWEDMHFRTDIGKK